MSLYNSPLAVPGFRAQWDIVEKGWLLADGWTRTPENNWINPADDLAYSQPAAIGRLDK